MTLTIDVPEDLYRKAQRMAAAENVTVEEIFTSSFALQAAAWERLEERAARGSHRKFQAAMSKVPARPPEDADTCD